MVKGARAKLADTLGRNLELGRRLEAQAAAAEEAIRGAASAQARVRELEAATLAAVQRPLPTSSPSASQPSAAAAAAAAAWRVSSRGDATANESRQMSPSAGEARSPQWSPKQARTPAWSLERQLHQQQERIADLELALRSRAQEAEVQVRTVIFRLATRRVLSCSTRGSPPPSLCMKRPRPALNLHRD